MYLLNFFNLLRLIGIDIVQTTMSVSTLYLFPFSSYMQKTKHNLGLFTKLDPFRQLKPLENLAKILMYRSWKVSLKLSFSNLRTLEASCAQQRKSPELNF